MPLTKNQKDDIKLCLSECLNDKTFIVTLATAVAEIISGSFTEKIDKLQTQVTDLNTKLEESRNVVLELQLKVDNLEQNSKVKQLRLYGLEESNGEKLKEKIHHTLGAKLKIDNLEIEACHRIGQKNANNRKPRPVRIFFNSVAARHQVFYKKKILKGSNMVVVEELTNYKYNLLQRSKEKVGKENAWSKNGKIYVAINGKSEIIKTEKQLNQLM